jgi:hypothetical protein
LTLIPRKRPQGIGVAIPAPSISKRLPSGGSMYKYFAILLCFLCLSCSERKVTEEEKALLFTIDDFQKHSGDEYNTEGCEKYNALSLFIDTEINYYFDSSLNNENADFLYLNSGFSVMSSIAQADAYFDSFINSYKSSSKMNTVEIENMLDWGDEKYFANLINNERKIIGNLIAFRYKKINYRIVLIGIYFDDSDVLHSYLSEVIDPIKAYADKISK